MVNTFINPGVSSGAKPGWLDETAPIRLWPEHSESDVELVIRAAYRQVLGNAYVMESERLTVAESQLKQGILSVREFVRQLAKSELYRTRFFESCYRYRTIELNFKHLLGRAPDRFEEMRYHSTVLDEHGFETDIDTYIDSDEYQTAFGEDTVPYYRGYQTQLGQSALEFTNMLQLLRSAPSSDKSSTTQNKPQLTRALIQNSPYSKGQARDASDILAEVFRSQASARADTATMPWQSSATDYVLQQKVQEQAQEIERLQQQLSNLRPVATIGAAQVKNDWHPAAVSSAKATSASLQQQANAQAAQIETLQEQIADARRYAAIGEARLNKWRGRTFSG